MEIAKLILEYIKALAWPGVTLGAALVFRRELSALFARLEHVKLPGGAELDWKRQLQAVEQAAEKVEARQPPPALPPPEGQRLKIISAIGTADLPRSPSDYDFGYYRKLSETDPNLALAGLRMELERMLQNLARISGLDFQPHRTSPGRFSGLLRSRGLLDSDEYELLRSIINVANSAVHGQSVSQQDALKTIESAEVFLGLYLEKMAERLQVPSLTSAG